MRARGLKLDIRLYLQPVLKSRPMRARGLKLCPYDNLGGDPEGRAPCGRVD